MIYERTRLSYSTTLVPPSACRCRGKATSFAKRTHFSEGERHCFLLSILLSFSVHFELATLVLDEKGEARAYKEVPWGETPTSRTRACSFDEASCARIKHLKITLKNGSLLLLFLSISLQYIKRRISTKYHCSDNLKK